jgi:hypothetical protein
MFQFTVHSRPVLKLESVLGLKVTPGQSLAIFDLSEIIQQAFLHSMTPLNITSEFMTTGISPFNPDIFTDDDMPQCSSQMPGPNINQKETQEINQTSKKQPLPGLSNMDSSSGSNAPCNRDSIKGDTQFSCIEPSMSGTSGFVLKVVRPLPKAPPRNESSQR